MNMANSWYNIESETGRSDADNIEATLTSNPYNGGIMAKEKHTTIQAQIASLAPSIHKLLTTKPSRIRGHVTSGDVVNGYGYSLEMALTVEVLTDQCETCGETQFTAPIFDCPRHKFHRKWRHVASAVAPTLIECLSNLDTRIARWLDAIERRAA